MLGSGAVTLLLAFSPELAALPGLRVVPGILVTPIALLARDLDVAMASSPMLSLMLVLAFANGWLQAGGWPPCVKIAGQWFPLEERGKTMGVLGTSLTLGSAAATLTVGALVSATAGWWRVAFLAPAIVLFASFAHMRMRLRETPGEAGRADLVHAGGVLEGSSGRLAVGEALRLTVTNPRIWILALGLFGLDAARYGVLDWAPGHLAEVHRTGALSAALKIAVFPIAGAAGALASGPLTDRYFGSRRAPVCALMLCAVGLFTLVYRFVVDVAVAPTVISLALIGFCLYGAQILLVGTAAQDFARRGATAAAAGFVDFLGYMGAFSGDVVTGWMLKHHGWSAAIAWWASAAIAAGFLVATLWTAQPEAPGDRRPV
jgi:sugar phosphate permease